MQEFVFVKTMTNFISLLLDQLLCLIELINTGFPIEYFNHGPLDNSYFVYG